MATTLNDITGIGLVTVEILKEHGVTSVTKLAGMNEAELCSIQGFGPVRARLVLDELAKYVHSEKRAEQASVAKEEKQTDKKKGKKKKSKKIKVSGKSGKEKKSAKKKKKKKDKKVPAGKKKIGKKKKSKKAAKKK